jgi:dephospho-CoA kinase
VLRVGLTGGIGTGKSYVLRRFAELGVATIDADRLARDAVARGTPGLARIVQRFGRAVLTPEGTLDRARLAEIVFSEPAARADLEAIVHPSVDREIVRWYDELSPSPTRIAMADVPLLYEIGSERRFHRVGVAACDPEEQVRRIVQRDGLTEAAARKRLAAQLPIEEKVARADYVIWTDRTFEDTDRQVEQVHKALQSVRI